MKTATRVLGFTMNSQRRRRMLVVALYMSYGCILVPFWLAHAVAKPLLALALPVFLICGVLFWGLSQLTQVYAYSSSGESSPLTDERQAQVRDRSFTKAYWILAFMLCFGIIYVMLASDFGWWSPDRNEMQSVFFGVILLTATLPSAVIAWVEGDEIDDTDQATVNLQRSEQ